jgi:hypothetical protein
MEFFIDGCVPFGQVLTIRYDCTPTGASYIQSVGSIPELGVPLQSLMIGTFPGGPADSFSAPVFGSKHHRWRQRAVRPALPPPPVIRFETPAGRQAQVDLSCSPYE